MSSGHDNKRKRKANVPNVNDASPPPGRRVSARCRLPPKTSQDSPSSSSETQDLVKLKRRKSPPGAENPTRISPRRPRPQPRKDGSDSPSGDNMAIPSGLHTPVKSVPKKVMSRKVKILEEKEADNRKGYTSDGMSFESLPDDDLPDINIASPYKGKQYSKDDIVWAPFNTKHVSIYWPAVVTSVKGLNICFLYINFYGKPVYKTHAKRLIPFDNSSKNLELKELGNKTNGFKEAYELVIKYYCNRKQNTSLNARRFLTHTYDENDKVGLAKNCLFRLTGKLDSHSDDFEEVVEVEGVDIVNDVDINEEDDSCEEEKKPDSPQSERIKEILEDLETLPDHMTVSSKQHDRMREEAEQLLSIIQSKDCFEHLMEIRQGTLESSRHKKFMKGEKVQGGLGPFTLFMDLTDQFLSALDSHCDCYDSYDYKHNVMLPEAIIFGIMKLKKVSKLNAKKYFHQTCHKLGIRD